jgi:integrase
MRLFRQHYHDRNGQKRAARNWTVEFSDTEGNARRLAAFVDRSASEQLGRQIERLLALRVAGGQPDVALARWIETLPWALRERLGRMGVLDPDQSAAARSLEDLLARFEAELRTRERTSKHIDHVVGRADSLFQGCGFTFLSDIDGHIVERHLHDLRTRPKKPLSAKSSNHWLAAGKQFTRWAVRNSLLSRDPLAGVPPVNARIAPKRVRRALTTEALRALIQAAHDGPERCGLSGPLRAMIYRLVAETGLRANEVQSLRVSDFELSPTEPFVTLPAAHAKNRREARLPLREEIARDLVPFLQGRLPSAQAFPLPHWFKNKTTRWLGADLAAAGMDRHDASGRVFDFHSLRAQFVTNLVQGGASPRAAQVLARHSSSDLTLSVYTKLRGDDERRALALLPDLAPQPSSASGAATGTDGHVIRQASCKASERESEDIPRHLVTPSIRTDAPLAATGTDGDGGGGGNRTRVPESLRSERLRACSAVCVSLAPTPTDGLRAGQPPWFSSGAKRRGAPTSPLLAFSAGRGHSRGERLPRD